MQEDSESLEKLLNDMNMPSQTEVGFSDIKKAQQPTYDKDSLNKKEEDTLGKEM